MGVEQFEARAKKALQAIGKLNQSIAEVGPADGHFNKVLSTSGETKENLKSIGSLGLSGSIGAAVHLTRGLEPPVDLDAIKGDPGEAGTAWATGVVFGKASANFDTKVENAGWKAGASARAGGGIQLAVHRRHAQTDGALTALVGLLPAMTSNPFTLGRLRALGEDEVVQYEMKGTAALSATAGWSYGTVRELSGKSLEKLGVGDLDGVKAEATAGMTLAAGLSGELSVLVTRAEKANWRRVELHKKKGHFVGAGLELKASLALTQEDKFVDGVLGRALALPDGLVGKVGKLHKEATELEAKLAGLGAQAKSAVEKALGSSLDDVGLDKLKQLGDKLSSQNPLVQQALAPIQGTIASLAAGLGKAQPDLGEFVDGKLAALSQPLTSVNTRLSGWIDGYSELRGKIRDQMVKRAEQGVQAELSLGVNRSSTKEALVVLEFDLDNSGAAADCLAAMKGNFNPGLLRANGPGAHGVELVEGALKDTIKHTRNFSLKLNLFGLKLGKSVKSWKELTVKTDLTDDSVSLVGQAATKLYSSVGKRIQELSFVFDVCGAALRRDDGKLILAPDAGFTATVHRRSEFAKLNRIRKLVPQHLSAAQELGAMEPATADLLASRLLDQKGSYSFTLDFSFPTKALRRAFRLDRRDLRKRGYEQLLWDTYLKALNMFDQTIQVGQKHHLVSALVTKELLAKVWSTPDDVKVFDRLRMPKGPSRELWFYVRSGYDFVRACADARSVLLSNSPAKKVNAALRKMSRKAAGSPGTFGDLIDAKYLSLALVEGPKLSSVTMTLTRGKVSVTL
jgi:hypothetical protein